MRQKLLCVLFLLLAAAALTGSGGLLLRGQMRQFDDVEEWIEQVAQTYIRANDPALWNDEDFATFEGAQDKQMVIKYLIGRVGPNREGQASALILSSLFGLPHETEEFVDHDGDWWGRYQQRWKTWWEFRKDSVAWNTEARTVLVGNDRLPRNPGLPSPLLEDEGPVY